MWKTDSPFIAILARLVGVTFHCDVYQTVALFALLCAVVASASGQTSVLTQHNDNARTGQNTSETILNTSNVNSSGFGKLFAMPVDGKVYAQPLYIPGITINGAAHNVVIIATENDSVYAYDADSSGAALWRASLVDAGHGAGTGETALNSATTTGCEDMVPQVGITSTPVIDATSKTVYVEAKSTNGTNYFHRLHGLDLLTGNEKSPGPVAIVGSVPGMGDGMSNGQIAFNNLRQLNRPGLLLLNGTNNSTIYIAYASHCDTGPYHGWLFAYDVATFAQKSVYMTTPNGGLGGFWMTGNGVAADANGNIFIASGNGDFDMTSDPLETGDTILKLGTANQNLTLLDYFTPEEQSTLDGNDLDLGSGGVLLLPDQPGSFPHILVEAGKEGRIYVINRDQMTTGNSHYCSGCSNDPEIIEESGIPAVGAGGFGMFNSPAYWNNTLYFGGVSDVLKSIPITNGVPDFTHVTKSSVGIDFPGAGVSVSSNGTTAGSAILWAVDSSQFGTPGPGPGPAVLYALDATTIATVLYSSAQNAGRDAAGNAVKFTVPTVANGKVYVGTSTEVDAYGLLGANPPPSISSITPSNAVAGGPSFPLTVDGTGFAAGATVNFGSSPAITPSSVTGTQIIATIPAADIATAGTVNVTVTNPAGGGTSNAQTFTINNPAPSETSLSPTSATAGGAAFTLTVNGTGFVSASAVKFNGAAKTTTFVSATQLTAAIIAADIVTAGTATVTVTNPAPGGGTSANLSFTISAAAGPALTSTAPTSATAGGASFTLTLAGTGFVAGATVNFGSNPAINPSSVTSTQIVATIPAADITTAGTVNVTVTNPTGGGTSNAQSFTINNPAPTETSLSPTSATAGGAAFTLTVNGAGFVSTSVVKFNGAAKTTTFVSATQLTAAITAADIATAGTATVTVTNPAPSGGTSASLSFTISTAAGPTLTSTAPTSAAAGGASFTLTLTGTGFVAGATINFGSSPAITPSTVTSTQILVTIPAADITTAGTVNVTVTNPTGGGTSNAQSFTINNPTPTGTSLSPTSATAGGAAFTLTVNGTGFVSTSVVKFNGAAKTTTFVSATQLTAAITAADIATAGTATVTVTNPAPGGGTSANLSFTISAAAGPALTSTVPTSATAGGASFTLTLAGTGFVTGATVNFGSSPAITPSSVTGTQIIATIPAADITTAGTVNVTVTNPTGGGTSNAQTFTINNPAPSETSLSPTSATAGGAAFTLTVNGTGFVSASAVKFNGAAKTTTFVSATQLTAAITAADIVTAGTATVTVANPAPSGTSNALSFTINNPVPTLSSLSPSSAVAGSAAFTLTVNGVGFVSGATVNFNGAGQPTTFATTSQITAAISASDIATSGIVNVTVTNPAPTAGPSAAQVFTISANNPVPTISSLGATHAPGGAPFSLTINGANFEAKSVVNFNGRPETTTFMSATKLTATIPASDVAIVGSMNVIVTNPAPGGGTSAAFPFIIDGYTISGPAVASLSHGHPAIIQVAAAPTANGFPNSISFSVSGLPAGSTASFNPATLTPNGNVTPTTLTITEGGSAASVRGAGANPSGGETPIQILLAIWIAAILGWVYLHCQVRTLPIMKRYAALALFALILLTGGILSGCALGVTPSASTSQLTVTATSGTLTQTFAITLQVTR